MGWMKREFESGRNRTKSITASWTDQDEALIWRRMEGSSAWQMVVWIDSLRIDNYKVSRSNIQSKALEIARETGDTEFVASRGWLHKFQ